VLTATGLIADRFRGWARCPLGVLHIPGAAETDQPQLQIVAALSAGLDHSFTSP
jgi:hypothetical protein